MKTFKPSTELPEKPSLIAKLYPNLSAEEQERAEYNLIAYVELVRRIFERTRRENPKALTEAIKRARLKRKMRNIRLSRID